MQVGTADMSRFLTVGFGPANATLPVIVAPFARSGAAAGPGASACLAGSGVEHPARVRATATQNIFIGSCPFGLHYRSGVERGRKFAAATIVDCAIHCSEGRC